MVVASLGLRQRRDNLAENQETFVDVDRFFCMDARRASQRLLLGTCQVDQLKPTHGDIHMLLYVLRFDRQREDAVTTTGELVEVVTGEHLVLRTKFEKF